MLFVDFLSSRPDGSQEPGEHRDIEASAEHIKGVAFPAADELLECQVRRLQKSAVVGESCFVQMPGNAGSS